MCSIATHCVAIVFYFQHNLLVAQFSIGPSNGDRACQIVNCEQLFADSYGKGEGKKDDRCDTKPVPQRQREREREIIARSKKRNENRSRKSMTT